MKLVCPNCGAQYAVDDRMIPASGRDVQCSNCSYTWFQYSSSQDPDLADDAGFDSEDIGTAAPSDGIDHQEAVVDTPVATEPDDVSENPIAAPAPSIPEPSQDIADETPALPPRRALDDRVFNVLREEAAREKAAREREAQGNQPSAEITPPSPSPEIAQPKLQATPRDTADASQLPERSEDAQLAAAAALAGRAAARRDLLPDIEEINSSLRPDTSGQGDDGKTMEAGTLAGHRNRQKNGFRIGFSAAVAFAAIALGLYLHGPKLTHLVPNAEPSINSYVSAIDRGRLWLDRTLLSAIGTDAAAD